MNEPGTDIIDDIIDYSLSGQWINSNHILPVKEKEVLIHLPTGHNIVGCLKNIEYVDLWVDMSSNIPVGYVNDTWWMNIPKIPKTKGE